MNILGEESDQLELFFVRILNVSERRRIRLTVERMVSPCCCSLTEKLHQTSLNIQPEHSREIEEKGHEYEVERDPLVVCVVDDCVGVCVLISCYTSHYYLLQEKTSHLHRLLYTGSED